MNQFRRWFLSVILAWSAGCLVAPLPSLRSEESTLRAKKVLSLAEAIELALFCNPRLELALNSVNISSNEVKRERGDFLPAAGTALGTEARNITINRPGGGAANPIKERKWGTGSSGSVTSSLTLYNGGANRATLERSKRDLDAVSKEFLWIWQTTIYESILRYLTAVRAQSQIDLEQAELKARLVELEAVQAGFDANDKPITDLLQQRALVAESQSRVAEAEQIYERGLLSLKQYLLVSPRLPLALEDPAIETLPSTERQVEAIGVKEWLEIEKRYDVLAQEDRIIAAQADIRAAQARFLPTMTLNAASRTSYSSFDDDPFKTQFWIDRPDHTVGVAVNVPIYNRNQTRADVCRARLLKKQEEILLTETAQAASVNFVQARVDFNAANAKLDFARKEFAAISLAAEGIRVRYASGDANIAELSQIQSRRVAAATRMTQSRFDVIISLMNLAYQGGQVESYASRYLKTCVPPPPDAVK